MKCKHKWMAWDRQYQDIGEGTEVISQLVWKCKLCGELKVQYKKTYNIEDDIMFEKCIKRNLSNENSEKRNRKDEPLD